MNMASKSGRFRERKPSRANLVGIKGNRKKDECEDYPFFKVYTILSLEDTVELMNANIETIEKKLISFLHLDNSTTILKDAIILDYFMEGVIWARDQEFSPAKFSGFFTVLHELFENLKEKQFRFQENIKHFRRYYGGIGLTDISHISNTELFNIKEAKKIITYFCTTFFQHYTLYEYVFTHTQAEELIGTQLKIEGPKSLEGFCFPPLIEALSESMLDKYKEVPLNSEESQVKEFVPIKETLVSTLTDEEQELLQQLTKDDVQEVFKSVLSEALPDLQPGIAATLQAKEYELISRIKHLCRLDE